MQKKIAIPIADVLVYYHLSVTHGKAGLRLGADLGALQGMREQYPLLAFLTYFRGAIPWRSDSNREIKISCREQHPSARCGEALRAHPHWSDAARQCTARFIAPSEGAWSPMASPTLE